MAIELDLFPLVPLRPVERDCPVCGRHFQRLSDEWVYSDHLGCGRVDYCSWSCFKSRPKRESPAGETRGKPRLDKEERQQLLDLLDAGFSSNYIAKRLNVNVRTVLYYRKRYVDGANAPSTMPAKR